MKMAYLKKKKIEVMVKFILKLKKKKNICIDFEKFTFIIKIMKYGISFNLNDSYSLDNNNFELHFSSKLLTDY